MMPQTDFIYLSSSGPLWCRLFGQQPQRSLLWLEEEEQEKDTKQSFILEVVQTMVSPLTLVYTSAGKSVAVMCLPPLRPKTKNYTRPLSLLDKNLSHDYVKPWCLVNDKFFYLGSALEASQQGRVE